MISRLGKEGPTVEAKNDTARQKIEPGCRVGKLTVLRKTEERKSRYAVWQCRCDCGGEILLDTRCLQRGTVTSCGCSQRVKPGQKDLTGGRFGRLTALEPADRRGAGGSVLWRCRCDCGNEAFATAVQLCSGYKKSCGCMRHPTLKDYVGKRFGRLTVTGYHGKENGLHCWECRCDCGNTVIAAQSALQSGKTKNCGCMVHTAVQPLSGQRFGALTVLEYAGRENGQSYWRCRCDCGKETVVRQSYLLMGKTKSCGCLQARIVAENMKFIDGTSVTRLEAAGKRLVSTNSSGYNGVYLNRRTQKWVAQIGFKGKTYYLGSYPELEAAAKARKEAEERLYGEFLEWYYRTHPEKKPT